MAVTLWMISDSVMSLCKITEQELEEDLVVVPQLCLESSYCPWWALTDGHGWLCAPSYPLGYISPLFSSVFLTLHSPLVHTGSCSLFKVWEEILKLPLLVLRLVGLLLAGLSPAQMKQSMQGTAAATDQSSVVKHAGAKLGRHDELFRKLGHSGKSLRENVFFI